MNSDKIMAMIKLPPNFYKATTQLQQCIINTNLPKIELYLQQTCTGKFIQPQNIF